MCALRRQELNKIRSKMRARVSLRRERRMIVFDCQLR